MAMDLPASGLLTKTGEQLPLRSVAITANIKGYVLGLCATMKYFNNGSDPVEVLYKLPLESKQAIVGLTACINGNKIRAEIQEKEQAKANYDDAIASGLTAAYGEKKTGDIFSVALGNLPGGEEAEIELQMVEELPVDAEGKVRFSLPATFKPRYTPQGTVNPVAPIEGSTVEHGTLNGFQEFLLQVHNSDTVAEVTSPTHNIIVTPSSNNNGSHNVLNVTLENSLGNNVTSDLVIQITHNAPHEPMVTVEPGKSIDHANKPSFLNHPAIMVNFFPDIPQADAPCELIFLVDRSGSMSGNLIKSAADTLILFLKSIPEGSYFNIYGFGSSFESLFPSSVLYNQDTLTKATAHAQSLTANLGGTEVLPPLREIFALLKIEGFSRQIFLLTDGSVSNTTACVDIVKTNHHIARCFTFGIGSGASSALVNGIAEAGNGTAEFIKSGERLQPKVIRSLKHALQPAVTDVKVNFSTSTNSIVNASPKIPPPLFDGDKTVVYGIIESDNHTTPLMGEVTLTGSLLGATISHTLPFEIPPTNDPTNQKEADSILPVHRLAAKCLLEEMQNGTTPLTDIIKMSIEAQVISNKTAFIAINENTTKPVSGSMKTYDIQPAANQDLFGTVAQVKSIMQTNIDSVITRGDRLDSLETQAESLSVQSNMFYQSSSRTKGSGGWFSSVSSTVSGWFKGSGNNQPSSTRVQQQSQQPPPGWYKERTNVPQQSRCTIESDMIEDLMEDRCSLSNEISDCLGDLDLEDDESEEEKENDCPVVASHSIVPAIASTTIKNTSSDTTTSSSSDSIILLQQANGSWDLNKSFSLAVGISLGAIESACPNECNKIVWATILAVVVLKVKYASQQDEWEMVMGKGMSWLKKQVPSQLDELMETAKKIVK